MGQQQQDVYYVPSKSYWPIVAAVVMFITVFGAAHWLNAEPGDSSFGKTVLCRHPADVLRLVPLGHPRVAGR